MKKYIFNLLLLFCCTCSVYAQNSSVEVQTNRIEVEGLVTDESKEPLIGVNVIIKDIPGLGAITDIDGKFKIKMEPYHRLVFSFIGFEKTGSPDKRTKNNQGHNERSHCHCFG